MVDKEYLSAESTLDDIREILDMQINEDEKVSSEMNKLLKGYKFLDFQNGKIYKDEETNSSIILNKNKLVELDRIITHSDNPEKYAKAVEELLSYGILSIHGQDSNLITSESLTEYVNISAVILHDGLDDNQLLDLSKIAMANSSFEEGIITNEEYAEIINELRQ